MRRAALATRFDFGSPWAALASLAIILSLSIYGAGIMTGLMLDGPQPCTARAWP